MDVFLLEDASDTKFVGLLTDGSMSNVFGNQMFSRQAEYGADTTANSQAAASNNSKPSTTNATSAPSAAPTSNTAPVNNTRPVSTAFPRASAPVSVPPRPIVTPPVTMPRPTNPVTPVTAAPRPNVASTPVPAPRPVVPVNSGVRPPAPPVVSSQVAPRPTIPSTPSGKQIVKVSIVKSEHGIGLDIAKTADGGTVVQKLKDMPPGVANPALACKPAILPGDVIIEVNGEKADSFATAVKLIRASEGTVTLTLERTSK